jgi:hypothetical protein
MVPLVPRSAILKCHKATEFYSFPVLEARCQKPRYQQGHVTFKTYKNLPCFFYVMVFAGYVGIPSFVDILQTIIYSIIS